MPVYRQVEIRQLLKINAIIQKLEYLLLIPKII